jgi:hypothetical protein
MSARLDMATNVAVIAVCALIGAELVSRQGARIFQKSQAAARAVLHVGDTIAPFPGLDLSRTERTLLIIVRTDCGYCTQSLPFYRRLLSVSRSPDAQLAIVSAETQARLRTYLAGNDIRADLTLSVDARSLTVDVTPTLILVDRKGLVRRIWRGRLDEAGESEVVREVSGG